MKTVLERRADNWPLFQHKYNRSNFSLPIRAYRLWIAIFHDLVDDESRSTLGKDMWLSADCPDFASGALPTIPSCLRRLFKDELVDQNGKRNCFWKSTALVFLHKSLVRCWTAHDHPGRRFQPASAIESSAKSSSFAFAGAKRSLVLSNFTDLASEITLCTFSCWRW